MTSPLRLGILGTANIARGFAPALRGSALVRVDAIASRVRAKADAFADEFDIAKRFDSYEALLADPDLDAIYNPLPNSLHLPWTIQALEAGKHVLCEKPLALNVDEATRMFAAAKSNGVGLLEAFPYMFQPQTQLAISLVESGRIGTVESMQAAFGFHITDPANVRFDAALGGGSLLDAGCYAVSFIRLIMGTNPVRVTARARWHQRGVDESVVATLEYADGRFAQISCSMRTGVHRHALIVGSHGVIDTDFLNNTSDDAPGSLLLREGMGWGHPFAPQTFARGSGFRFEAEAFARYALARDWGALRRWQRISLDTALVQEAIAASMRGAPNGQPVDVPPQTYGG
jgi:predicted dehydrogenase